MIDSQRKTWAAIVGILGLGAAFLWLNLDLPIVRNAETYAQSAYSLLDAGLDPRPVVADTTLSCGKPIGFPMLGAPWVSWLGANRGLKIVSFLGTALFVLMSCAFMARLNAVFGLARDSLALQTLLLCFNPLLIYQFWSAYPDTLFAALSLAVLLLVDDAVYGASPRLFTSNVAALLIIVATLIKYYGVVLMLMLPLAYLCPRDPPRSITYRRLWFAMALLPAAVFVAAGALGFNTLLAPTGKGGGAEQYVSVTGDPRLVLYVMKHSLISFLFAVGIAFSVLTALFVTAIDYRALYRDRRRLFFVLAGAGLLFGLLPFDGTPSNIRYFVPVLPFLAVVLAHRLLAQRPRVRYALLATFLVVETTLILSFNVPWINEQWARLNRPLPDHLENLRLGAHIERQVALDLLDRTVTPGATVYLWSDYYDGCVSPTRARLWHEMGLARDRDVDLRAVPAFSAEEIHRRYYVWVDKLMLENTLREPSAADIGRVLRGTVTQLGPGFFEVDP